MWVVVGSHHSLSLLGWTSLLAPPNGPEEPVWGLWQGHTGWPTPWSSQLQKRHIRSAEGGESGEEGRANPVNQPNQLKLHGWTRESAMSQPAPLHPALCVCHLRTTGSHAASGFWKLHSPPQLCKLTKSQASGLLIYGLFSFLVQSYMPSLVILARSS